MEYVLTLIVFAGVHFVAAASPGPNLILVSSRAMSHSFRGALLLSVGIVAGTFVWSSAAALGLGVIIAKFPTIYEIVKHIGAIYLIWLGFRMMRDAIRNKYEIFLPTKDQVDSGQSLVAVGFFVNMTNPKSIVYWTGLFSVVLPSNSPNWVFLAAILIAVTISLIWWVSVSLFFSDTRLRSAFFSLRKCIDSIMGGALMLFGVKILYDR